jgi:homoserine O-acetyltransferase
LDHPLGGGGGGGIERALAAVQADTTVIAIDSDRLYPPRLQFEMASLLPGKPQAKVVESPYGHDGFLIEAEQVGRLIAEALPT